MGKVFKENPMIILRKFGRGLLYSAVTAVITYSISFVKVVDFEPQWVFLSTMTLTALHAMKKAVEEYDWRKDIKPK